MSSLADDGQNVSNPGATGAKSLSRNRPGVDPAAARIGITSGRQPAPYAKSPVWLIFAVSNNARALYDVLAAHLNADRQDATMWATRKTLATHMKMSKAESVDRYIAELEAAGAIDVIRRKNPDGTYDSSIYVVHHEPPDTYVGPRSMSEYYRLRGEDGPVQGAPLKKGPPPQPAETDKADIQNQDEPGKNSIAPAHGVVPKKRGGGPQKRGGVVPVSGQEVEQLEVDNHHPPTPQDRERDSEASGVVDDPDLQNQARALVDEWRARHRRHPAYSKLGQDQYAALVEFVRRGLVDGLTPEQLTEHAYDRLETLHSPSGLVWRFESNPPIPALPGGIEELREHCGNDSCISGFMENEDGAPIGRCPQWPHSTTRKDT